MATTRLRDHNIVASFRDLELADEAIRALADAGATVDDVSVLGRTLDELELRDEEVTGEPIGGNVLTQSMTGGAVGGLAGGVVGLVGGVAAFAIPGVGAIVGSGLLWSVIAGVGAGSTAGAFAEGVQALSSTSEWDQTLQAIKDGAIVVGVHVDDEDEARRFEKVLTGLQPMWMHRLGADDEA